MCVCVRAHAYKFNSTCTSDMAMEFSGRALVWHVESSGRSAFSTIKQKQKPQERKKKVKDHLKGSYPETTAIYSPWLLAM